MVRKKHEKKKQYLNNVDVPLSKSNAKVMTGTDATSAPSKPTLKPTTSQQQTLKPSTTQQPKPEEPFAASKYVLPELFSSLAVGNKIEKLKNAEHPAITSAGQLTPNSKKQLNKKITKKLNYQVDANVFTKLMPVRVADTELPRDSHTGLGSKSKYQCKGKKDPEPTLSDYVMPREPFRITVFTTESQPFAVAPSVTDNYEEVKYTLRFIDGSYF